MDSKAVRPIILVGIFIVSLFVFSFFMNQMNKDTTITMEEATLPIMQFVYEDETVNELHGYTKEMDLLSMRDELVPVGEDRKLNIEILTYGSKVEGLSFEIRSLDGKRLLMEEDEAEISSKNGKTECQVNLPSLFDKNVEYNIRFVLKVDGRDVYYYTRLIQPENCYVKETIEFALKFNNATFTSEAQTFIPTYMDPATGDATRLNYVDLSCTLKQIAWANFKGVKLTDATVSIKEITPEYNVILLKYVITNVNENKEVEYYNVEEYYRLRQSPNRIYVLNFERRMNQIFRGENDFQVGVDTVLLGIRDPEVEYLSNESGSCVAFVQEGEIWVYDRINNTISKVFSFRGQEGIDPRENWDKYSLKLIRQDEAGSITFAVYGYMNRGVHEGQVGLAIYHYDAIARTVKEEIFIESNKSYDVFAAEVGDLIYVSEKEVLYVMLSNNVYEIDMATKEAELMIESDTDRSYAVSNSGRYLAWIEDEHLYDSPTIKLMDLRKDVEFEISAEADTYLLPLTFFGEDLVYGVAEKENVKLDTFGEQVYPMSNIRILNTSEGKQDVIKNYRPLTGYIGNVTYDKDNVYLELIEEQDGRFVTVATDTIMNRETQPKNYVELKTINTDVKQKQVGIGMKSFTTNDNASTVVAEHILQEEYKTLSVDGRDKESYYVYVRGEIILATKDVAEAIQAANEKNGMVVDSSLRYIFKRARSSAQNGLKNLAINDADKSSSSVAKSISVVLNKEGFDVSASEMLNAGQTPYSILKNTLTDATVLELRGLSLDELLYFMDQETPVYAQIGHNQAVLLTGYSTTQVYYYDTASQSAKAISYSEMEAMLYAGGNYNIVYIR